LLRFGFQKSKKASVELKRHAVQIPTGFCRKGISHQNTKSDLFLGILLEIRKNHGVRRLGISRAKPAHMSAISVTQRQNSNP
jgi:hypothetical protein